MPSRKPQKIDEALLAERLAAFQPEPLVKCEKSAKPKQQIEIPAVEDTGDGNTLDLAKTNFLNLLNNKDIQERCEATIRKYGVGTCGPRAFYGTTDVHLELEERIAKFLGMQESIVYSYGFVAISSSIAAYCKKNDIVFTDTDCNVAIQQGLQMAKCKVVYFNHQDPESFAKCVEEITEKEKQTKRTSRKFLVVEGVSWKTGKILALPEFLKIAEANKIRVFLEESYSIGILGETGKGLMEYFNIEPWRLDMIIATLEAAIGSIGGFCAGSHMTIEHQRLSGSGYIFSASLPTFLVQACIESLNLLESKPHLKLQTLARDMQDTLMKIGFAVQSDPECPFKVFNLKEADAEVRRKKQEELHAYCAKNGVHFILTEDSCKINLNVNLLDDSNRYRKFEQVLGDAFKLATQ